MSEEKAVKAYVVDAKTSEVIDEYLVGDRIKVKRSVHDESETAHEDIYLKDFHFAKLNTDEFNMKLPELTREEISAFMHLSQFLTYGTGRLDDVTTSNLAKACKVSRPTARKVVDGLISKGLLAKSGGAFYINPWILSVGPKTDWDTVKQFLEYMILSKNGLTWREYFRSTKDGR